MGQWIMTETLRKAQIQIDRGTENVWGQEENKGRGTTKNTIWQSTSSKPHPSLSVVSLPAFLWCGHHSDEMHPDTGLDVSNLWAFSLPCKWTTVHSSRELVWAMGLKGIVQSSFTQPQVVSFFFEKKKIYVKHFKI